MTEVLVVPDRSPDGSVEPSVEELIGAASAIGTPVVLAPERAHADELGVLHRHAHFKVRVEDLQHQVIERFPAHLALLDVGDAGRSVVRVHNHFSDLEFHCGSLRR